MALILPPEAASQGKNWWPLASGAMATGAPKVAPPSVDLVNWIWPW
jgi:hypothetical protein